ncbi:MAG: glycine cleavage system aminomethyltransferase GcvT [Candidatus Omnitrophica bacterium]|nr:glycine cleavage system aminomethyltransferase GcvT [Candidatus Omnitrophota bacterium]
MATVAPAAPLVHRSVLHAAHQALGARFSQFGGWEMPLSYTSILKEHQAVRTACGMFDVSHLGQVEVTGPSATASLQRVMTQDVAKLADGQAAYTPMCHEQGGILDEMIVYRLARDRYRLVINAGNADRDVAWLREQQAGGAQLHDLRTSLGVVAIQGPKAAALVESLGGTPLADLRYYHCRPGTIAGRPALIARTGYTGEDGFELMAATGDLAAIWEAAHAAGRPMGLLPAGLGARDTLRLEAGMPLYGHDIDETTTPFEVGIGRTVAFSKPDFIGRAALWRQSQEGLRRRLVGFVMDEPGVPRQGYPIQRRDATIGQVTSGTHAPTLGRNIGLGYVTIEASEPGATVMVVIHQRPTRATVVQLPFYHHHGKS